MPSGYHYNLLVLNLFIVFLLGLGEVKCMDCHIIVNLSLVINFGFHQNQRHLQSLDDMFGIIVQRVPSRTLYNQQRQLVSESQTIVQIFNHYTRYLKPLIWS